MSSTRVGSARTLARPFALEAEPTAASARAEVRFLDDECGGRLAQRPRLRRAGEEVDVDATDSSAAELDPTRRAPVVRRRLVAALNRREERRADDPGCTLSERPRFRDADGRHVAERVDAGPGGLEGLRAHGDVAVGCHPALDHHVRRTMHRDAEEELEWTLAPIVEDRGALAQ